MLLPFLALSVSSGHVSIGGRVAFFGGTCGHVAISATCGHVASLSGTHDLKVKVVPYCIFVFLLRQRVRTHRFVVLVSRHVKPKNLKCMY